MILVSSRAVRSRQNQPGRGLLPYLLAVVVCVFGVGGALGGVKVAQTITGEEAQQHLQETNTVCGVVASTKYVESAKGKPTYLNFDHPYPNQTFTAIVTEGARAKFKDAPETTFKEKNVCVTGLISANSRGKPQIMIEDPSQIRIDDTAPPATNQTTQGTAN